LINDVLNVPYLAKQWTTGSKTLLAKARTGQTNPQNSSYFSSAQYACLVKKYLNNMTY
jgi:hypothetical protein